MSLEGKLVTFEGIDGCGKGTQLKLLRDWLNTQDIAYNVFREPGGTDFSEKIRATLLDPDTDIDAITEMLYFQASRADLAYKETRKRLQNNELVILDRYFDSTTAYQGAGIFENDPKALGVISAINNLFPQPDKTFYFQISVEESKNRLLKQGVSLDRLESRSEAYHQRVKDKFDELAQNQPSRFVTIDGTLRVDEIHKQVISSIDNLYT